MPSILKLSNGIYYPQNKDDAILDLKAKALFVEREVTLSLLYDVLKSRLVCVIGVKNACRLRQIKFRVEFGSCTQKHVCLFKFWKVF